MFQCLTALRVFCFSGRTACPLIFADLTGLQKPQKTDVAARISRGYPPPVSRWDAVRHWKGSTKNKRRCNVIFGDLRPLRCFRRKRTSSQRERLWQPPGRGRIYRPLSSLPSLPKAPTLGTSCVFLRKTAVRLTERAYFRFYRQAKREQISIRSRSDCRKSKKSCAKQKIPLQIWLQY